MQGREAADCSKVRHRSGSRRAALRATAKSSSRNDALEKASSPPQGTAAPHGLHPPLPSLPLLPSPATPVPASAQPFATTAKLQRCALAFPAAQPQRDSSGAGIRRGTAPTQTHRPRACWPLGARRCHVAHLPKSKFKALAHFTLQACCMSKQICLQSVRLSVCQYPGVKEPTGRRSPRDKDATGGDRVK